MTTTMKRLFLFGNEKSKHSRLNLTGDDVVIARDNQHRDKLRGQKEIRDSGALVWRVPRATDADYNDRVRRYLAHDVLRYQRFEEAFELVVLDPDAAVVTACEDALTNRTYESIAANAEIRLSVGSAQTTSRAMIGEASSIRELRRRVDALADDVCPVLIIGPTGSGKELVARQLHERSKRTGDFATLNGAMLHEETAEAKLFGHTAGAFTDAKADKPGRIEEAASGTFFLDELFHVPEAVRPKLLRALADAHRGVIRIQRMGGRDEEALEVRLVTAVQYDPRDTDPNGPEHGRRASVRNDLYYRVAGEVLEVPALCDRLEDIELLTRHFAGPNVAIDKDAIEVLMSHPWPGNVRELRIVISRVLRQNPERVTTAGVRSALDVPRTGSGYTLRVPCDVRSELAAIELRTRERALRTFGSKRVAAQALGLSPKHWSSEMEKLRERGQGREEEA